MHLVRIACTFFFNNILTSPSIVSSWYALPSTTARQIHISPVERPLPCFPTLVVVAGRAAVYCLRLQGTAWSQQVSLSPAHQWYSTGRNHDKFVLVIWLSRDGRTHSVEKTKFVLATIWSRILRHISPNVGGRFFRDGKERFHLGYTCYSLVQPLLQVYCQSDNAASRPCLFCWKNCLVFQGCEVLVFASNS